MWQIIWFRSFLKHRTLSVDFNQTKSDTYAINYGSPQGGVISPTLFSIFINDLKTCLTYCENVMFADDTTFLQWLSRKKSFIGKTEI